MTHFQDNLKNEGAKSSFQGSAAPASAAILRAKEQLETLTAELAPELRAAVRRWEEEQRSNLAAQGLAHFAISFERLLDVAPDDVLWVPNCGQSCDILRGMLSAKGVSTEKFARHNLPEEARLRLSSSDKAFADSHAVLLAADGSILIDPTYRQFLVLFNKNLRLDESGEIVARLRAEFTQDVLVAAWDEIPQLAESISRRLIEICNPKYIPAYREQARLRINKLLLQIWDRNSIVPLADGGPASGAQSAL